tara:strand:- start:53 stop:517 length:465 start_codon:yes stop_codon:yes gene_type:complete
MKLINLFCKLTIIINFTLISGEILDKKDDKSWKDKLSEEEYFVTRCSGTEPPFTGKYYKHKEKGTYNCNCCKQPLFSSDVKYDSGSGWPSFWDSIDQKNIKTKEDLSLGHKRIEIICANCDAHLGHVFEDGPNPTGLRYCVNSLSLDFKKKEEK